MSSKTVTRFTCISLPRLRYRFPAGTRVNPGLLLLAFTLPFSLLAQDAQSPTTPDTPVTRKERQYVRRVSVGVQVGLIPFSAFGKETIVDSHAGPPKVENDSTVGARGGTVNYGFIVQATITNRTAVAIAPSYRNFGSHAFIKNLVGTDLSSTLIDERVETDINEDTKGHMLEVPVLGRWYTKGHNESGKRVFFEAGPNFRMTSGVSTARSTLLPSGATVKDNIPLDFRKDTVGASVGLGGQFIDDFGIRVIPEIRFTRWITKSFDSYHGHSRTNQLEINLTFSF